MTKKFKFWCKGTSKNSNFNKSGWWTYPNFLLCKYFAGIDIFESPDFEACQWTGLFDRNGNEIYEGSIVKWDGPHESEWIGVVKYLEGKFIIEWVKTPYPIANDRSHSAISNQQIVIGNIFENKDLIKNNV